VADIVAELVREKLASYAPHQPALSAQQRKQVTILFADVSGFTAMADLMDAEDVAELMNALWQRIDHAILSQGGQIDKHIGDAVMAVWGAQVAREDDPERALHAALAIQSTLATFDQLIEQRDTQPDGAARAALQVRIGINTGPVLLGSVGTTGEFTAMGDTVNVAARLERAAPVGSILISRDTYRHIRGLFDVQELAPILVKGKPDPLHVYHVLRARPRAFRMFARGMEGIETPMVGRDRELHHLQGAFQSAIQQSEAQLTLVLAEAGMGKSRLLYEFNYWLDQQPELEYVFKGRASQSTQHVPYALLRDVLLSWLRLHEHTGSAGIRSGLEQGFVALLGPPGLEVAHFIGHLIGLDLADSPFLAGLRDDLRQVRSRALQGLARLMAAIGHIPQAALPHAAWGGVVLLDDLHWADTSSLDIFAELMQICRQMPILLVCGARPTVLEHSPEWRAIFPHQAILQLDVLSDDSVALLASSLLRHTSDLPAALRQIIVRSAEGNPFYVEELIKMLIEDGVISVDEQSFLIAVDRLPHVRVPPTLTGVLQSRLDSLAPAELEVLQCAAVVGRVFWDGAIAMLVPDGMPDMSQASQHMAVPLDLDACLEALQHKEMIFTRPSPAFAGTREYIFKHALLRDVAYERVLRRRRRGHHTRVARWLELTTRQDGQADAYAALIAEHYDQAGSQAAALWYTRAGLQAAAQFANVEAVSHFSRALALTPTDDLAVRYGLLLAREQVYDLQGARQAQERDLDELATLADALSDNRRRAQMALRLASFVEVTGDPLTAAVAAEHAIDTARVAGDTESEAAAHLVWGRAFWHRAAYAAAQTQFDQSLALAQSIGAHRLEGDSLHYLGIVALEQGNTRQAQTYFAEALELFQTIGDQRSESAVLNRQGDVAARQGDYSGARATWEQALSLSRKSGDRRSEGEALDNLAAAAVSRGAYQEARVLFEQALECCREIDDRYGESRILGELGNSARAQGDYVNAQDFLTQALNLHSAMGERERAGWVLTYLSMLFSSRGNTAAALDYSLQALRVAQDVGSQHLEARASTQIGHHHWRAGLLDEAASSYWEALTLHRKLGAHNLAMEPMAGMARVALDRERLDQARLYTEEILTYLALITLDGAEEPLRVYLTCYEVLEAMGDARAAIWLARAHTLLHNQAAQIDDLDRRSAFLEGVPTHQAIEAAWGSRGAIELAR
jgi:class 3 adenylate cyclase/tetratricopeptide (TPR) repeat protein